MAPEVVNVQSHGGYGPECDVWAVGITSIELAERQPPFYDMQPMQVLYIMTKPRFKSPQLKEKSIWYVLRYELIALCNKNM
jgi:serine/threonine protein kinase